VLCPLGSDATLGVWNAKPNPGDVKDDAWACVAPYVTLMTADAPQRTHRLRDVCHGLRWIARAGAPWRMILTTSPAVESRVPTDPPPVEDGRV
jgi:transposase